ncbi:MAG: DUF503 domain-containing protein [Deltaproteobacteria bacterium]|nr:DUF503 domain-containing protein [Deltaproteobacteria bacterium]
MVVAVARLTLMLHDNHSLKGKRKVVRSLIERVKHRFDAAIAEVEDHDKWQRAQIGIALVGSGSDHAVHGKPAPGGSHRLPGGNLLPGRLKSLCG